MRSSFTLLLLFAVALCPAQTDSSFIMVDSIKANMVPYKDNAIINQAALNAFYQKLSNLGKGGADKVNIVHIGDSHIQADLMTAAARTTLQQTFGNGGRGFVFPHNLAKTNGAHDVSFSSTGSWKSRRNIYAPDGSSVGLSGIALESDSANFAMTLKIKDRTNFFTTIEVVAPGNDNRFSIALSKESVAVEIEVPKKISHKIRKGETLSAIAEKYNVGISQIKAANRLRSNMINAGKVLVIPSNQTQRRQEESVHFNKIEMQRDSLTHVYKSTAPVGLMYLLPNDKYTQDFVLSGMVLQNDTAGVVYHNIGVNGAKFSDYNKFAMFFDQLPALKPDLIVLSLGTNESFDKMTSDAYFAELELFVANVRKRCPAASILISTAPPSMFQKKYPNTFVADYARKILENADEHQYAVWDLYSLFGGLFGVADNVKLGLIGGDRVHYSRAGYQKQGTLLAEAIIKGMQQFKD